MWIKLIITLITIFLLFDEYFKVIDKVKKKNKRKLLLIALSVLSIFSLIDVIIEVNEGNKLVEKANDIIIKSDTLISQSNAITFDLKENIESVKKTGESLVEIDSILKEVKDSIANQVQVLNSVVSKSKELVELEEKRFNQDHANLVITNDQISIKTDSLNNSSFIIEYAVINSGRRAAEEIFLKAKVLFYNKQDDKIELLNAPTNSGQKFPSEIVPNLIAGQGIQVNVSKETISKRYDYVILVIYSRYRDELTNNYYITKNYFASENIKNNDFSFGLLVNYEFITKLENFLIEKNLREFVR